MNLFLYFERLTDYHRRLSVNSMAKAMALVTCPARTTMPLKFLSLDRQQRDVNACGLLSSRNRSVTCDNFERTFEVGGFCVADCQVEGSEFNFTEPPGVRRLLFGLHVFGNFEEDAWMSNSVIFP
jgi:hypothetical protein